MDFKSQDLRTSVTSEDHYSTRNLIEIVLIQDYSLRYSADQSSTGGTYALLCRQGGKHSVINSIPAENLRPLPISSFAKRHFYTKC